jgi:hypothetical protein
VLKLTDQQKINRLVTIIRRFMLEHNKGSSSRDHFCRCPICVEAGKLLERVEKG